jgi:hypothetical protein
MVRKNVPLVRQVGVGLSLAIYVLWFVPTVLDAIHEGGRQEFCFQAAEEHPDLLPMCQAMRSAAALSGLGGWVWLGAFAGAMGLYRVLTSPDPADGRQR